MTEEKIILKKDDFEIDEITYDDKKTEWQVRVAGGTKEIMEKIRDNFIQNQIDAENFHKIKDEYNARWNTVEIVDRMKKRLVEVKRRWTAEEINRLGVSKDAVNFITEQELQKILDGNGC